MSPMIMVTYLEGKLMLTSLSTFMYFYFLSGFSLFYFSMKLLSLSLSNDYFNLSSLEVYGICALVLSDYILLSLPLLLVFSFSSFLFYFLSESFFLSSFSFSFPHMKLPLLISIAYFWLFYVFSWIQSWFSSQANMNF